MAQVSVKDVAEIRLFSQGVQDFHDRYEYQLVMIENSTIEDIATAKELLEALGRKAEAAERQLHDCEQALHRYLSSHSGRQDKDGNPIPPDPDVVRQLTAAIKRAEEQVMRARHRYEEGKETKQKACMALEMAADAARTGMGVIRDQVASACTAIERAALQIELYRG